jgi:AraC family L-rhamnose operon transcriptional activator RhaR
VGQSPSHYIRERRVMLAAQQLLFSSASIDDIALATGFGNRFYFSRVFTRQLGVSPAAYRKTSRV